MEKHMEMWLMLIEVRSASRYFFKVGISDEDKLLEQLK
jgi:hypothetical protein